MGRVGMIGILFIICLFGFVSFTFNQIQEHYEEEKAAVEINKNQEVKL
jgi:hypothetical protein